MPGPFDELFQGLSAAVIELFTTEQWYFVRLGLFYDEAADVETPVVLDSVNSLISPPSPFDARFVDGKRILAKDLRSIASAEHLGDFDPVPTSDVTVTVTSPEGRVYQVEGAREFRGGDEVAMYGLQLRP